MKVNPNDKLFLFVGISKLSVLKANEWIQSRSFGNPAVIYDHLGELQKYDFECPAYTTLDLILTNSLEEEEIYKEVFLKKNNLKNITHLKYDGIDLLPDLWDYSGVSFESNIILARSIQMLYEQGHDVVIICLTHYTVNTYAVFDEALDCGLVNSSSTPLRYDGFLDNFCEAHEYTLPSSNFLNSNRNFLKLVKNTIKNFSTYSGAILEDKVHEEHLNKPLLFLSSSSPLYVNNFIPVYQSLCQRLNTTPFLIGKAYLTDLSLKHELPLIVIDKFKKLGFVAIVNVFLFVIKMLIFFNRKVIVKDLTYKLGENTFEYIVKRFYRSSGFIWNGFGLLMDVMAINKIIVKVKPVSIYKQVSITPLDETFKGLGRKYCIPVISSNFASIDDKFRNFDIKETDFITLLGEEQIPTFLKRGFSKDQLILVGQPELDVALLDWSKENSLKFLKEKFSRYSDTKRTFLIVTSCFDRQGEMIWIRKLSEILEFQDNVQVFIKPHPSRKHYYNELKGISNIIVTDDDYPLYPFLQVSDWVITDLSHSGKLAIFFNKKLIVVNCSGSEFQYNKFDDEGLAHSVRNLKQLNNVIADCIEGRDIDLRHNYVPYIKKCFYSNDGKAADRIVEFLMSFPKNKFFL